MTIEEKLEHFYDVSVKEAEKEAQQQLEKHQEHLEQILCEHKEIKQKKQNLRLKQRRKTQDTKLTKPSLQNSLRSNETGPRSRMN